MPRALAGRRRASAELAGNPEVDVNDLSPRQRKRRQGLRMARGREIGPAPTARLALSLGLDVRPTDAHDPLCFAHSETDEPALGGIASPDAMHARACRSRTLRRRR